MAKKILNPDLQFDDEADEEGVAEQLEPGEIAAVVTGTDWTTETIVSQLTRGNIQLNPRFQRRDAWKQDRKSRFIESLIVGLPIPQIVLAEAKRQRGKFIVLDGKQRLLTILQFWGNGEGTNNEYRLSGMTLREDLDGKSFADLSNEQSSRNDFDALCNQTIRTVVIRNWKDTDFLHTVFLRLNTGSVSLSPQELRQALLPGEFANFVDDRAAESAGLRKLLGISGPDPRMRDTEILARFISFRFFAEGYPGRMKGFLDATFETFNSNWADNGPSVERAVSDFEDGVKELVNVFGDELAKKPSSRQFNRAIFDALIYFHSQPAVRKALRSKAAEVRKAYKDLFSTDSKFLKAIESDTAGASNTSTRLNIWAAALSKIIGNPVKAPKIPVANRSTESTRGASQ
ncbi:DUF262 domain-containing protein [Reyranella sp.]|uniref:DUF262 domain-containing protein n=1 Tax=Reyranella sp. TaxID=1929291 RepID=UPI003D14B890